MLGHFSWSCTEPAGPKVNAPLVKHKFRIRNKFRRTDIQTQDDWVRSTNATSLLCDPLELYLEQFKVEFPAVTICASGRNDNNLEAGFWNLFLKFMDEAGSPLPYSAVQVANKMRQVTSAMWHFFLNGPFPASFFIFVFSG